GSAGDWMGLPSVLLGRVSTPGLLPSPTSRAPCEALCPLLLLPAAVLLLVLALLLSIVAQLLALLVAHLPRWLLVEAHQPLAGERRRMRAPPARGRNLLRHRSEARRVG